jgi:hypothetical protein
MKTLKKKFTLIFFLCILLASASWATAAGNYSGFLGDYPSLKPDKDRKGAMIYRKPGVALANYTKLMLDPIEIWIAPDSKYKGIKPDQLKALADTMRDAIVSALEPTYPVVSRPGPGVLGLRIAITNVQMRKAKKRLVSFTPIGLVVTGARALAGKNISLVDATIEVEMLDSETNERLGVLIDRQSDTAEKKKKKKKKMKTSWDDIEKTLKFYAERFRVRMDAEHGR